MFREPKAVSSLLSPIEGDTAETILIKKQCFLRMGKEAKEVLRVLVQMPEEFFGIKKEDLSKVRKKRVMNFFRGKYKWSVRTTTRAFRQAEEFWRLF